MLVFFFFYFFLPLSLSAAFWQNDDWSYSLIVLSLLMFLNPFHIYSIWGFMTENYFLLFLLLSFHFFLSSNTNKKGNKGEGKNVVFAIFFALLAFFIRQFGLILFASYFFYELLFPKTDIMLSRSISPAPLFDFNHMYKNIFMYFVYFAVFIFPIVVLCFVEKLKKIKGKILTAELVVPLVLTVLFFSIFGPMSLMKKRGSEKNLGLVEYKLSRWEFPYMENTFERSGFFPDNISGGKKYKTYGSSDLFNIWGIVGVVGASILISLFLLDIKRHLKNPSFVVFIFYFGMILILPVFYDRYLLHIFPFLLFTLAPLVVKVKKSLYLLLPYVIFLGYLGYAFSADFVKVNRYVWEKSESLVVDRGVEREEIDGVHAWRKVNGRKDVKYKFTYDSPELFEAKGFELIEEKKIDFFLNPFRDFKVYLYGDLSP